MYFLAKPGAKTMFTLHISSFRNGIRLIIVVLNNARIMRITKKADNMKLFKIQSINFFIF